MKNRKILFGVWALVFLSTLAVGAADLSISFECRGTQIWSNEGGWHMVYDCALASPPMYCAAGFGDAWCTYENVYFCEDSDGGRAYYTKGSVTANSGTFRDYCSSGGFLVEYYCDGFMVEGYEYDCDRGLYGGFCENGRCYSHGTDPENPPVIVSVGAPQTVVSEDGRLVVTQVTLKNTGGGMTSEYGVEQQIRPSGFDPLAFLSNQMVCDHSRPENVHRMYKLASGESVTVSLTSVVPSAYNGFEVYLCTATGCGGAATEPYPHCQRVYSVPGSGGVDMGLILIVVLLGVVVLGAYKRFK